MEKPSNPNDAGNQPEPINSETYSLILSNRLNHLQFLLSAMYGFIVSFLAAAIGLIITGNVKQNHETLAIASWIILLWAHFFVSYQTAACIRCVKILKLMKPENVPIYFTTNKVRVIMFTLAHIAPSFLFVLSPLIAEQLWLINKTWRNRGIAIGVMVFVLTCITLYFSIVPVKENKSKSHTQ